MSLAAGIRLGPYEILSPLGAGGMGEVWKARDTRLEREVAIKLLPEGVTGPESLERFRREARAASALNHPHICAVHDVGEHEGRPFLVMERMRGLTLREAIGGKAMPVDRVLQLGVQIADALEAAHGAGIVHRDIKPANVFVTERGDAKLLDFGLAKTAKKGPIETAAATAVDEEHLTSPGATVGTVAYMSPEQAKGDSLDARTDLFSLGVVLYEMATGRLPFPGRTAAEIFNAILSSVPASPESVNPEVPQDLDRLILKALEKDRDLRYQSAGDLKADLKRLLRDSSSGKASATASRPVPSPVLRRALVLGVSAVVVALASGVAWLALRGGTKDPGSSPATGPKRIAVLPFENVGADEDGYFADGMTEEVRGRLGRLEGVSVIASSSTREYRGTTKSLAQIARELGVNYLLTATVRWQKTGGTNRIRVTPELVEVGGEAAPTALWQEAFEADLADVFRVQGEVAAKVAGSLRGVLSPTESRRLSAVATSNRAAIEAYLKGREADDKGGAVRTRLEHYERAVALDPNFSDAWAMVALLRSANYLFDPSAEAAEAARASVERMMELAPDSPGSLLSLGLYHRWVRRDRAKALEAFARGLRIEPESEGLLNRAAEEEVALGRWEEALARLRRAREVSPRSPYPHLLLGLDLVWLRRIGEARRSFDDGLGLAPHMPDLIVWKAITFLQEGDLQQARGLIASVPAQVEPTALVAAFGRIGLEWVLDEPRRGVLVRLTTSAFENDSGTWGLALARASTLGGDSSKAREYAEVARKALEAQVSEAPDDPDRHMSLGLALALLGRRDEAVREGERSVALLPIAMDADEGPALQYRLVLIHILCGNREKAIDLLEPLLKVPYVLTPAWLRIDPNLDPLRGNPRFEKLVGTK